MRISNLEANEDLVLLNGEITDELSLMVSAQIRDVKDRGKTPNLFINSPGGSVFAGYNIIQAIMDTHANTHIVGIAASMAGIIAQFGTRRTANDFGRLMIHKAQGKGRIVDLVTQDLMDIFKANSVMTDAFIDDLMDGKDHFFDAVEMLKHGLIDDIIDTNRKMEIPFQTSNKELFEIYNNFITESEMKEVKNYLKLEHDASDTAVISAIKGVEDKVTKAEDATLAVETTLEEKDKENKTLTDKVAELNKVIAEGLIEKAIASGKISEDDKDLWIDQAVTNYAVVEKQLVTIKAPKMSVENQFKEGTPDSKSEIDKDVVAYVRDPKNAKALEDLRVKNEARFIEIMNNYNEALVA